MLLKWHWKRRGNKMDEITLAALKGSVTKWERICNGIGCDHGGEDCPLCQEIGCRDCPIAQYTGNEQCRNTPYEEWIEHNNECHHGYSRRVYCSTCQEIAEKELHFLRGLYEFHLEHSEKNLRLQINHLKSQNLELGSQLQKYQTELENQLQFLEEVTQQLNKMKDKLKES
jgi:hypothetical protein